MRKTKIICTIGPASESESVLTQMCKAGMNVARLNFSHGSHEEHQKKIDTIKKVRKALGLPIAIMLDTKGPEYRIKTFENGKITIKDGLAMTSQNKFYRPISELDNDGGYADIFLSPLCDIYKDMVDSYIIELKYCKSQTTDEQVKKLFEEASAQISRHADSDMVREAVKTTKLHKLVVIYRGAEMVACEEI